MTEVIRVALNPSGLDGIHAVARIQDQEVKDIHLRNSHASAARGNFGYPTFFVGPRKKSLPRPVAGAILSCTNSK